MNKIEFTKEEQVFYLNTRGFDNNINREKKDSKNINNIDTAKKILEHIFEISNPECIIFSEFDFKSLAGKYTVEWLYQKGYYHVLPNSYTDEKIKNKYTSIVIIFVKDDYQTIKSVKSPDNWLKWNEINLHDYKIIGLHAPGDISFWEDWKTYHHKNNTKKIIYIGDLNLSKKSDEERIVIMEEILKSGRDLWIDNGRLETEPNAWTYKPGKTRIDRVIVTNSILNCSIENHQEFSMLGSDHTGLLINICKE